MGAVAETREKMTSRHIMFIVTCCFIMATCVGLWFNSAGIFYSSVAADLGVGLGSVSLYISITYFVTTVFLPFAGRMLEKYDARALFVASMLCMFAAYLMMWAAPAVWMFYIAGVPSAFCIAFALYLLPVVINRWFKQRVGFVVGLASSFSGIGAALWNPLGAMIIEQAGWRMGYLVFGIIQLVLTLPLVVLCFRGTPMEFGLQPYGASQVASCGKSEKSAEGVEYARVLKSPSFYLFCGMAMVGPLIAMINMYLPAYASTIGMSAVVGASLASVSMIGNLLGKIVLGGLADKSMTAAVIAGAVAPFVGIAMMMWLGGVGDGIIVAASFIFGMCNGNAVVILPVVVRRIYGERDYAKIWSNISSVIALFAGIGASLWGFVYDGTQSYVAVFFIGLGLCIVLVLLYFGAVAAAKRISREPQGAPVKGRTEAPGE